MGPNLNEGIIKVGIKLISKMSLLSRFDQMAKSILLDGYGKFEDTKGVIIGVILASSPRMW